MIKRIYIKVRNAIMLRINKSRFIEDISPMKESFNELHELLLFSYEKEIFGSDKKLANKIEKLRTSLASDPSKKVRTFGSPHSNAELFDDSGKVVPGVYLDHDISGVAKTGTNEFGGIQLKRIVDAFGHGNVLELGTNTGLSGCYFLSSDNTEHFYTIEGSPDLCKIADINLKTMGDNYTLYEGLFDDVLNSLDLEDQFMYAFIDGQHEKQATIHYMEKIFPMMKPGGILILDDIYWSEGMLDAWNIIKRDSRFDLSIDFGWRGIVRVAEHSRSEKEKFAFNLTKYHGEPSIQRPGW